MPGIMGVYLPQASPNYLICMSFIRISRYLFINLFRESTDSMINHDTLNHLAVTVLVIS